MSDTTPKTAGIPPAQKGVLSALSLLQFTPNSTPRALWDDAVGKSIEKAAQEVASYHAPTEEQAARHRLLANAAADLLFRVVQLCPPGPERSTAISRIREGKMWASAAVALEGV